MSLTDRFDTQVREGVSDFNRGTDDAKTLEQFADDVTFVVPGRSALAGTYKGRDNLARFFAGLHEMSGGTFKADVEEILPGEERMVLFMRFTAERDGENLDVVMAGFHDDHGPDGWRKASFLVDDQAAFDRFFAKT
jgi:ketosteroid isomerase-like protein